MKDAVLHQFCANAFNTHKLPPLMIGRYEIFGIRKNLSKWLPIIYEAILITVRGGWLECIRATGWNHYLKLILLFLINR